MEEEKKEFFKYVELETVDGPIYLYEVHEDDPGNDFHYGSPVVKEFFTGEEGTWDFDKLLFLDGKCAIPVRKYNFLLGTVFDTYYHYLEPSTFLERVLPYLLSEEDFQSKREEIMNIFKYNANLINTKVIKRKQPTITEKKKNEISYKILKKYVK